MRAALPVAAGLLVIPLVGCGADERAPCALPAHITFEGKTYIAADDLPGRQSGEVRVDERLGTGQLGTCPGEPEQAVDVFRVAGVSVERAVFSKPKHGLMRPLGPDEAIE
jgi:hypothetical protein